MKMVGPHPKQTSNTMGKFLRVFLSLFLVLSTQGQQYDPYDQEYAQDNLYHDYAARQQEKAVG